MLSPVGAVSAVRSSGSGEGGKLLEWAPVAHVSLASSGKLR